MRLKTTDNQEGDMELQQREEVWKLWTNSHLDKQRKAAVEEMMVEYNA